VQHGAEGCGNSERGDVADFAAELDLAREIVAWAARHLRENRASARSQLKTAANGDRELVTNLDIEINDRAIAQIGAVFPDDSVIGEEGRVDRPSSRYWIIDPIDGTRSFLDGRPGAAIVLALVIGERPRITVVHDIDRTQTYVVTDNAIEGVTLSQDPPARVALWNPYLEDDSLFQALRTGLKLGGSMECESTALRALGIAQGAGCVFVSLPRSSKMWDSVAAIHVIGVATGTYTDFLGAPIGLNPTRPVNMRGALGTRGVDHATALEIVRPWLKS
jgi:fructose-1,6-bisphosphatase/inositol monophosphatase family enzyme